MSAYMWNARIHMWTNVPLPRDRLDAIRIYLLDRSDYIYWSTNCHLSKIRVGDQAFIWRTKSTLASNGIVAVGRVSEIPTLLTKSSITKFKKPERIYASGWDESNATSDYKTGITIEERFWDNPIWVPIKPMQGTLRELKKIEIDLVQNELDKRQTGK